jgi:hypothetical protein
MPESEAFTTHFAEILIYLWRAEDQQSYSTMWAAMQRLTHHQFPAFIHGVLLRHCLF